LNKKYFIAIVLPSPALEMAESLKQQIFQQYGLSGALRSPAHITLHRPFEWKEAKEIDLINSLTTFQFAEQVKIDLLNFACFEPRVIYIDVVENVVLRDLHQQLKVFCQKHLKLLNEVNDLRGFHSHVTIAFRDLKKAQFYPLRDFYKTETFRANFGVNTIQLLKFDKKWEILQNIHL
jgi:2'-5' RNA ligase